MATYIRRIVQSVPYKPSSLPAKLLPTADLVEEEHTPHYKPQHFYPVRLYEILNNQYQIAAKIGWGTSSTVWLARDLHQWRWLPPRYVAIKVNASNYASQESAEKEMQLTDLIEQFITPELITKKDLVSMTEELDDDGDMPQFVDFISRMLCWRPEDRATAENLLSHPWLSQKRPTNGLNGE